MLTEDIFANMEIDDKLEVLQYAVPLAAAAIALGAHKTGNAALYGTPIDFDAALLQAATAVAKFLGPVKPVYIPAVPVEGSVGNEFIVSLIDGKQYKVLTRHLKSYGMTAKDYRERYGLPDDYPVVAPDYARARSKLAKKNGLGQRAPRKGKGKK